MSTSNYHDEMEIHSIPCTSEQIAAASAIDVSIEPRHVLTTKKNNSWVSFKSSRLIGEHPKEWLKKPDKRALYNRLILFGGGFIGCIGGGFLAYRDYVSTPNAKFCPVPYWEDTFNGPIDTNKWTHEVQLDGFGTGSFDWTTTDAANAYTDENGLHITPTLTTESTEINIDQLVNGYTLNLTSSGGDGSCTAPADSNVTITCSTKSNSTTGVIINPVRSARLSTRKSVSMRYGKIEVVAKLPKGDWLWPAIWMMPVNSKYGVWPQSGEIDLMESRGNAGSTYTGGVDQFSSTIHWGPNTALDAYWRELYIAQLWRTDFSKQYHTYALEWTPDYMYTYFDNKLKGIMYTRFPKNKDMWARGQFQNIIVNGSAVVNPWAGSESNAPFDQDFYLILNVAVGGTNSYFPDGTCFASKVGANVYCEGNKPWRNDNPAAMRDFWNARGDWLPTWGDKEQRSLGIKSVKMYKYGDC